VVIARATASITTRRSIRIRSQLAQQAPLSTSLNVAEQRACPLTLANGFTPCSSVTSDTFGIDPNFRIGYAQTWQLAVQRDLPFALQMTATYLGTRARTACRRFCPTLSLGAANPCPSCPVGFEYRTSNGNSIRESGQLQLRRRLRSGFTATLSYTYSKSIDDDAYLGGQGHTDGGSQRPVSKRRRCHARGPIAQNWLDPRAERSLSTFDQRHLLNLQAQYTSGQGLEGGTLLGGWRGRR
jgi:trimeric autotransporter adhesin